MKAEKILYADTVIAGTGVSGLYAALNLPRTQKIIMITKKDLESSDSFLAQGGICVQRDEDDYDSFFEDTMRAGHYENRKESVDIMIRSSRQIINSLIQYGVEFETVNGELQYTREGAHHRNRILFHEDETGREITSKLLAAAKACDNIRMMEYTVMTDLICENKSCKGIAAQTRDGETLQIMARNVILATGGIGGNYTHSTNFSHLTGDALTLAERYGILLEHLDYVQIHPTTLFSRKKGRRFLISESVRGEGALLYDAHMNRFTDELQPRDVVTKAILAQMEKDHTDHVWLDMRPIPVDVIYRHFPNIAKHCLEEGYDVTKECIPVVPAQHYFMGGIHVDSNSETTMKGVYAVGETSCNGVHGRNRLASNSLLESLVFAKRAAYHIAGKSCDLPGRIIYPSVQDETAANGKKII
ncbi:MAG: L-aspartate oxidase [Lachnospiraceae bacterium]|nr:L-aspartate oxidase [Lachnospiraceae bacterium]